MSVMGVGSAGYNLSLGGTQDGYRVPRGQANCRLGDGNALPHSAFSYLGQENHPMTSDPTTFRYGEVKYSARDRETAMAGMSVSPRKFADGSASAVQQLGARHPVGIGMEDQSWELSSGVPNCSQTK